MWYMAYTRYVASIYCRAKPNMQKAVDAALKALHKGKGLHVLDVFYLVCYLCELTQSYR